jgi:hypothetical protein
MGVVDWFRSERAQRKARRAVGDDGVLFAVAEEQAARLGKARAQAGDGRDDAGRDDAGLNRPRFPAAPYVGCSSRLRAA